MLHRQPTSFDGLASGQRRRHRHCLTLERTSAGRAGEPAPWHCRRCLNPSDRQTGSSAICPVEARTSRSGRWLERRRREHRA